MLITETLMVKLNGQNLKHFESLGYKIERRLDKWGSYSFKTGTEIKISVFHLKDGSHTKIKCSCDYCLTKGITTIITKEWRNYLRDNINSVVNTDCCAKCQQIKSKECNLINFGVENKMYIDEYKNKVKNTMLQRYGVENALQY